MNAGFPVPEAFFIIAKAYESFVEANELKEKIKEFEDSIPTIWLPEQKAEIQGRIQEIEQAVA
jgi:phosphoenolpyruvate synthase/pyruvate phosphate dikinase